ncbi:MULTISPECIES: hypothetical protein [unclassified Sphingopyxis]|jgi:hypothetical protein|uniref:hypothetical protein n=1 Tax=unclassified Sphingopyxis TaxID=2614943 RepID=UPI002858FC89|nr:MULTISPECIES: hypothetical protein [unclassified Sphingopyxis]MDR6835071.1 hypothetical protein [Sphingopyxis sp. BE122]MDR7227342.1 hypothetical protein [Sphingopyxis sp. BE259]
MTRTILASLPLFVLAACGSSDPAGNTTTKLDAVEVQPGSVSDSMIILDNASVDGTAVDNSVPDDGTNKEAAKTDEASAEDESADGDDEENPDAVPIPAAKKAITADTPTKKGD